jgi:hypothetical protein
MLNVTRGEALSFISALSFMGSAQEVLSGSAGLRGYNGVVYIRPFSAVLFADSPTAISLPSKSQADGSALVPEQFVCTVQMDVHGPAARQQSRRGGPESTRATELKVSCHPVTVRKINTRRLIVAEKEKLAH